MRVGVETSAEDYQYDHRVILKNLMRLVAATMILTGLLMVVFGDAWGAPIFELMAGSEIGLWLEHFVPFLPMAVIGSGAALFFKATRTQ